MAKTKAKPKATRTVEVSYFYLFMLQLSAAQKRNLAKRAGTTTAYLYQLAGEFRTPSWDLAMRLSNAAKGWPRPDSRLEPWQLRPTIWPPPAGVVLRPILTLDEIEALRYKEPDEDAA